MMNFEGQVAIITGGGDGLGRGYALWLAERGAAVVVNNRRRPGMPSSAQAVADEIVKKGGRAAADDHSVEDPEAGKAMVKAALEAFGRIDIVICNAAVTQLTPFGEFDLDDFRRVVDINLWGTLYPVHAAWPTMLKQGYGRIVLTTSTGGMYGFPNSTPYSTTKSSMIGLARGLALDVPKGADIKVNVIAPSAMTKMLKGLIPDEMGRALDIDNVVPAVGWLASRGCNDSGMMFFAAAGKVTRIRVVEGAAVSMDGEFNIDWAAINSLENVIEAPDVLVSLKKLLPS